jgi:hypothetical protein
MFTGMPRVLMSAIDPERHFFGTTSVASGSGSKGWHFEITP